MTDKEITTMSQDEVKVVKWVEWFLAPVLVVSIIGLGKCTALAQDELIVLQKDVALSTKNDADTKAAIKEILAGQHSLEISVKEVQTHPGHFKAEILSIKEQNSEIIKLLREK